MINTRINLIILILSEPTFHYEIVSLSEDTIIVPNLQVTEFLDIDSSIRLLMKNHLITTEDEEINALNYKLTDIVVADSVEIYYLTIITYDIPIQNAHRTPVKKHELILPNLQKIIQRLQ